MSEWDDDFDADSEWNDYGGGVGIDDGWDDHEDWTADARYHERDGLAYLPDDDEAEMEGISSVEYEAGFMHGETEYPARAIFNERKKVGGRMINIKRSVYGADATAEFAGLDDQPDDKGRWDQFLEDLPGPISSAVGGVANVGRGVGEYAKLGADRLSGFTSHLFNRDEFYMDYDELTGIDSDLDDPHGLHDPIEDLAWGGDEPAHPNVIDSFPEKEPVDADFSEAATVLSEAIDGPDEAAADEAIESIGQDHDSIRSERFDTLLEADQAATLNPEELERIDDSGNPEDPEAVADSETMDADLDSMQNPEAPESADGRASWAEIFRKS